MDLDRGYTLSEAYELWLRRVDALGHGDDGEEPPARVDDESDE